MSRLARIKKLHARALALDRDERAAFLREACDDDTREELESLLAAHERMGGFLEAPAAERMGAAAPPAPAPGDRVGGFEIVRRLAAGGNGTVYEAWQERPRRRVALKVMRSGFGSTAGQRRFEEEAEILARLSHPAIATVFQAGLHDGVPYFALEFVEGARTLLEHGSGLGLRDKLALLARVCDAVQHGHQKGVVHRDLKPGNVLVDAAGAPKVIDFGIARVPGARAREDREIVGTLPYMSPEQCEGSRDVDVRSDVYALGVLLHELVSGRPPHDVAGLPLTDAVRVLREEPAPPLRNVPADLAAIASRALARDREDRYGSAADLGRDLRRFLGHEPVLARRGPLLHRARLFARRHLGVALALATLLLVLVGGTVVSSAFAVKAERARRGAVEARELERRETYAASIGAADAALRIFDVAEARRQLARAPEELRRWEWSYLQQRLDRSRRVLATAGGLPTRAVIAPDGRWAVTASWLPGEMRLFLARRDTRTGEVLHESPALDDQPHDLVLSPSGSWLAWGSWFGTVALADPGTLECVRTLRGHAGAVTAVAFSADEMLLAACATDGSLRLWSLPDGEPQGVFRQAPGRCGCVAFHPRAERLAVGVDDLVEIWEPRAGRLVLSLAGHGGDVLDVAFSPDGARLLTCARDGAVRVWDTSTGALRLTLTRHELHPTRGLFAPDGERVLAAGPEGTMTMWDARNGTELATFWGHTATILSLSMATDGRTALTASADGTARLWDVDAPPPGARDLGQHTHLIRDLAYSPDGRWLAAASFDGTVKVYDGATGEEAAMLPTPGPVQSVCFAPDGRLLVAGSRDLRIRAWETGTWRLGATLEGHAGDVLALAFSPDGRLLASGSTDGSVILWEREGWAHAATLPVGTWAWSVAFDPSGRRLATPAGGGACTVWSVPGGEVLREIDTGAEELTGVAFAPDGRTVATASARGVHLWDAESGQRTATLAGLALGVQRIAFGPDPGRLAGAGASAICIWDTETGRKLLNLHGHPWVVYGLAFSPDGTQLASGGGGYDGEGCILRVWGRRSGAARPTPEDAGR